MKKFYLLLYIGILSYSSLNAQCPSASFTTSAPSCGIVNFTNTSIGTDGTWTYAWTFDNTGVGAPAPANSAAQNPAGVNYIYNPGLCGAGINRTGRGVYTVLLTISKGACNSTVAQQIDIREARAGFDMSATSVCENDSVSFYSTGSVTGGTAGGLTVNHSWSFGAGATPGSSTLANPPTVVYSTPGVKTITHQVTINYGGCAAICPANVSTDEITQTITVNSSPISSFTAIASTCVGTAINFTNTGSSGPGDTYAWDFGGNATPASSTAQNPTGISYSAAGTYTVTLNTSNSSGCTTTSTQNIVMNATPVANFTSTAPQCTGDTVDFTNTGTAAGVTYSWNFGPNAAPATSTLQNPIGIIFSTAGTQSVILTTTNTVTSCAVTATQTININQTPTASFIPTAPTCAGTAVNFTNTGSTGTSWSYLWNFGQNSATPTSSSENPVGIIYNSGGNKTVTFTISNGFCTQTSTQNIVIDTTPVANFTSTAPQCTGDTVDFTNTGTAAGVTYSWNFGPNAAPATSTLQNPIGIIFSTAGTQVVTLITTKSNCADTSTQTININQTPTASFTSTAAAPTCVGSGVNFTNTGSTGGIWSYLWDFGQDAVPQTSSSENPVGVFYNSGGAKTVTFTISNGFCTHTSTQPIFINSLPVANAGKDTTICANASVQIGSASIVGNTYSWFPASTLNNAAISNPISSPIAPVTQYIVTVTNTATTCVAMDTVNVTMLAPLVAEAGPQGTICRYDSVRIGAGLIKGQNYNWTPPAGLSSVIVPSPQASPSVTTTYTLSVTGSGCPPVTDQVTVIVHPLPIANAGPDNTITVGTSTQLVATGGLQYEWSPSYALSNAGISNPVANPIGTIQYTVTVTDIYGCVNDDSVTIKVITPSFWIPNAFTPNGDGISDIFIVRGAGVQNFEFYVFNRWGEELFYSNNINIGWDGTRAVSGDAQPSGAYVYAVKGTETNGEVINVKGIVNLIR